jgi:hypothetical protein
MNCRSGRAGAEPLPDLQGYTGRMRSAMSGFPSAHPPTQWPGLIGTIRSASLGNIVTPCDAFARANPRFDLPIKSGDQRSRFAPLNPRASPCPAFGAPLAACDLPLNQAQAETDRAI